MCLQIEKSALKLNRDSTATLLKNWIVWFFLLDLGVTSKVYTSDELKVFCCHWSAATSRLLSIKEIHYVRKTRSVPFYKSGRSTASDWGDLF
jgi:hypothetical protein